MIGDDLKEFTDRKLRNKDASAAMLKQLVGDTVIRSVAETVPHDWLERIVENHRHSHRARDPRLHHIRCVVAGYYNLDPSALSAASHTWKTCRQRMVGMYLGVDLTKKAKTEIGRVFNRDHSTVLAAAKRIPELMLTDAKLAADVAAIKKLLWCS